MNSPPNINHLRKYLFKAVSHSNVQTTSFLNKTLTLPCFPQQNYFQVHKAEQSNIYVLKRSNRKKRTELKEFSGNVELIQLLWRRWNQHSKSIFATNTIWQWGNLNYCNTPFQTGEHCSGGPENLLKNPYPTFP